MDKQKRIPVFVSLSIEEVNFCCGLNELGNMEARHMTEKEKKVRNTDNGYDSENDLKEHTTALFAVTAPDQTDERDALEHHGFEVLKVFRGNTGRRLTLWFRDRKRR